MPTPKGGGAEEFSQAVRLLKQAAEHGTTTGGTDDPRDAAVAVARSMRHFEAALEGTNCVPIDPYSVRTRMDYVRPDSTCVCCLQTRTLTRRRVRSWRLARRAPVNSSRLRRPRKAARFWTTWLMERASHSCPPSLAREGKKSLQRRHRRARAQASIATHHGRICLT